MAQDLLEFSDAGGVKERFRARGRDSRRTAGAPNDPDSLHPGMRPREARHNRVI